MLLPLLLVLVLFSFGHVEKAKFFFGAGTGRIQANPLIGSVSWYKGPATLAKPGKKCLKCEAKPRKLLILVRFPGDGLGPRVEQLKNQSPRNPYWRPRPPTLQDRLSKM